MARAYDTDVLVDLAGNVWQGAVGTIYTDGAASVLATDAFAAASGGSPVTTVTTDSSGRYSVYFTTPKSYWLKWTDNGHTAHPINNSAAGQQFTTFVSQEHQAFEKASDEHVDFTVTDIASRNALTTMIAGSYAWVTNIDRVYRYDGSAWKPIDDIDYINVLDFGAIPGTDTAPVRAANSTAINAACDAARSAAVHAANTRSVCVIVPSPALGNQYFTDAPINFLQVHMIGHGSRQGTFARTRNQASIINQTVGSGAMTCLDNTAGTTWLEGIYAAGDEYGVKVRNTATVTLRNFSASANVTGNADNATLVIENSFWIQVEYFGLSAGGTTPTSCKNRGPCSLLMIASPGGPINGIAQSGFRHGVFGYGGARFENRLTVAGSNSDGVTFDDVLTENQGPQAFLQVAVNGGTAAHSLVNWVFRVCQRADATVAGTTDDKSAAAVTIDAGGSAVRALCANWRVENCSFYGQWLFQCFNNGDIFGVWTNTRPNSTVVFDPGNAPANGGYGSIYHDPNEATLTMLITQLITMASLTNQSGLRIPHGVAPTSPVNGDMWTTTAGMFVRINGVTKTVTLT